MFRLALVVASDFSKKGWELFGRLPTLQQAAPACRVSECGSSDGRLAWFLRVVAQHRHHTASRVCHRMSFRIKSRAVGDLLGMMRFGFTLWFLADTITPTAGERDIFACRSVDPSGLSTCNSGCPCHDAQGFGVGAFWALWPSAVPHQQAWRFWPIWAAQTPLHAVVGESDRFEVMCFVSEPGTQPTCHLDTISTSLQKHHEMSEI